MHIAIYGILVGSFSCAQESEKAGSKRISNPIVETVYANEFGEIHLTPVNDSTMRTVFFNNQEMVFDTLMKIKNDFQLLPADGFPFLQLRTGGIKIYENQIQVYDFGGPTYMASYANIEKIYDRPFFKLNDTVTINYVVEHPKGGESLNGIYVIPQTGYVHEYVTITGIVTKEKYPRAYYSTADSPQGMFSDTTKNYYRLVIQPIEVTIIPRETMTGHTTNIDGRAAFIWDFADSEAYYLENHAPWTEQELDKKITLKAVLVQDHRGSILKNWEIIE